MIAMPQSSTTPSSVMTPYALTPSLPGTTGVALMRGKSKKLSGKESTSLQPQELPTPTTTITTSTSSKDYYPLMDHATEKKSKSSKQVGSKQKKRAGKGKGGDGGSSTMSGFHEGFAVGDIDKAVDGAGEAAGEGEGEYEAALAEEYRLLRARVEGDVLSLTASQEFTTPLPLDHKEDHHKVIKGDKVKDKARDKSKIASSSTHTTITSKASSSSASSSSSSSMSLSTMSKHHITTKVVRPSKAKDFSLTQSQQRLLALHRVDEENDDNDDEDGDGDGDGNDDEDGEGGGGIDGRQEPGQGPRHQHRRGQMEEEEEVPMPMPVPLAAVDAKSLKGMSVAQVPKQGLLKG